MSRIRVARNSFSESAETGAMDEEQFEKLFDDVPTLNIYTLKECMDKLNKIRDTITDTNLGWEKRVVALKELRALANSGYISLIDLSQQLRLLEIGLLASLRDLRSQVVREVCVTIAYLSRCLENKFEHTAECVLPNLIVLIQNSAKIMASAAVIAIKYIVQNTHCQRLIPIIIQQLTSKSNVIRRQCLDFISQIIQLWARPAFERHLSIIQEAIRKGLLDADADARMISRRAFNTLSFLSPEHGYALLTSFDAPKQRQLLAEMEDPTLFNDISKFTRSKSTDRSNIGSNGLRRSSENGSKFSGDLTLTPDVIPRIKTSKSITPNLYHSFHNPRGISRVLKSDIGGYSIPHLDYSTTTLGRAESAFKKNLKNTSNNYDTTGRLTTRTRPRAGVSQSQPSSRSGSPTRMNLHAPDLTTSYRTQTHINTTPLMSRTLNRPRRFTGPQSQGNSRETSPDRKGIEFKAGINSLRRGKDAIPRRPTLTTQHMAEYSKNLENAVADVWRGNNVRRLRSDEPDAYSEASSACSDNSYKTMSDFSEEVIEIIHLLLSGSWTDRKDSLNMILKFLKSDMRLSLPEVKKLSEIFSRIFHDPHPKVLLKFLEVLSDFIMVYACELTEWLPTCINRLLSKSASDVLGNLNDRIPIALEAVRCSFPHDLQLAYIMKFIVEQPQVINLRIKLTLLNYLNSLLMNLENATIVNTSDNRLAISRILTWASEPKSQDIKKTAQQVILTMHQLNPDEMANILAILPKSFQESASRIINGIKMNSSVESPYNRTPYEKTRIRSGTSSPSRFGYRNRPLDNNDDSELMFDFKKASEEIQYLNFGVSGEDSNLTILQSTKENGFNTDASKWDSSDIEFLIIDIREISNTDKTEEFLNLMQHLICVIRQCNADYIWDIHFKMILLLLFESIQHSDSRRKCAALKGLKELLENQSFRFRPYVELTIMKLLQIDNNSEREVGKCLEECSTTLAQVVPPEQCISVLNPICLTAEYPMNMAAIKMEMNVIKQSKQDIVKAILPSIIQALIKGFENDESGVRKVSLFCLLEIHRHIGDDLVPHLSELNPSKMKLLNVYIKRENDKKVESMNSSIT